MTKEQKQLLLVDLCARLPYGVYIEHTTTGIIGKLTNIIFQHKYNNTDSIQDINAWIMFFGDEYVDATYFKPILRPMSSMTVEEKEVVCSMNMISDTELNDRLNYQKMYVQNYTIETFDYFNERKLDYRGLIPMGLALEASEGMYQ